MNGPKKRRRDRQWHKKKKELFEQIAPVLNEMKPYWPLTLRQAYYQLVAAHIIPNDQKTYKELSRLLVEARFMGRLLWEAIEDRGRPLRQVSQWDNAGEFGECVEATMDEYRRDLLQDQPLVLEIWVEKEAQVTVLLSVAEEFGVQVMAAKGFSSISVKHELSQRVGARRRTQGKKTKILYFGDLDPSGWEMLSELVESMREDFFAGEWLQAERIALTPDQVVRLGLPYQFDAQKRTDARCAKFRQMLEEKGFDPDMAVELDALAPPILGSLAKEAIERNLDLSKFEVQARAQATERERLQAFSRAFCEQCQGAAVAGEV